MCGSSPTSRRGRWRRSATSHSTWPGCELTTIGAPSKPVDNAAGSNPRRYRCAPAATNAETGERETFSYVGASGLAHTEVRSTYIAEGSASRRGARSRRSQDVLIETRREDPARLPWSPLGKSSWASREPKLLVEFFNEWRAESADRTSSRRRPPPPRATRLGHDFGSTSSVERQQAGQHHLDSEKRPRRGARRYALHGDSEDSAASHACAQRRHGRGAAR